MIKGISVTCNLQVKSKLTEMTSRNWAMHLKSFLFKHVKDEERAAGKHLPHPNYAFLWINYCKWLVTCFQLNYVHWLDRTQSTCSCFTGRIFPALFHLFVWRELRVNFYLYFGQNVTGWVCSCVVMYFRFVMLVFRVGFPTSLKSYPCDVWVTIWRAFRVKY